MSDGIILRRRLSCRHGSQWVWRLGRDGEGAWVRVVQAANCDCGDPSKPDKKEAEG